MIGTLEPGKRADLVVFAGKTGDPYEALIQAKETSVRLVMINGVARYGMPCLLDSFGVKGETLLRAASAPLSTILKPITLDPLTVADDPNFLLKIAG